MEGLVIRKGTPRDIPQVLALIKELAEYEKAPHEVELTEEQMLQQGFGERPLFEFLVAVHQEKIIGLSLFYPRFSTWKGKGLYLEDLVVTQDYRGKGIGQKLLLQTARIAHGENYTGLYWQVLDWNTPAIEFYTKLGAQFDDEWINCKLDQATLASL